MPDTNSLPALLRLIDDPSETVRHAVVRELSGFGEALGEALRALPSPPDEETIAAVLAAVAKGVATSTARFHEGQRVRHKRYGYRGVVVAFDETCRAPDEWYRNNRTQPDRDQPWYHVLVHDSEHATYAAQSSLEPDDSEEEIRHPWVESFFHGVVDGDYVRNERPWPSMDD